MGNLVAKTSQNIAFHLRLSEAVDNAGLGNEEHGDKPDVIWHHQQQQGSQGHRMDSPNPDNYHNWPPHSAWETYFEAGNLCSCLSDICEGRGGDLVLLSVEVMSSGNDGSLRLATSSGQ